MEDAAVISGSLVDVRNVGLHKSVKLTIHVPEELAMKIMDAFGWPTAVRPVSVAIARLDPQRVDAPAETTPAGSSPPARPAGVEKHKRIFSDMSPTQQAGMLCADKSFQSFLCEWFQDRWIEISDHGNFLADKHTEARWTGIASELVRRLCKVSSRSEITRDNVEWTSLLLSYRAWQKAAEVVPA